MADTLVFGYIRIARATYFGGVRGSLCAAKHAVVGMYPTATAIKNNDLHKITTRITTKPSNNSNKSLGGVSRMRAVTHRLHQHYSFHDNCIVPDTDGDASPGLFRIPPSGCN